MRATANFLGGIGTMVAQTEICPGCGVAHESSLARYLTAHSDEASRAPARSARLGNPRSPIARRVVQVPTPWPMPSFLEERP